MRLRPLLLAMALAALAAAPAAGAAPQKPVTETATQGAVRADLSYAKEFFTPGIPSFRDLKLTISRSGHTAAAQMPKDWRATNYLWPGGGGRTKSVQVVDADGDREPEVLVDVYSGGMHCCHTLYAFRWNGKAYVPGALQTASSPYTRVDLDHDGSPEWTTSDPRFEYLFTAFAGSGLPLQIWDLRQGAFVKVTADYPNLVRKDAARWWGYYQHPQPGSGNDYRGYLAAWAADMSLLGEGAKVWPALQAAKAHGDLNGRPDGSPVGAPQPSGTAYIALLRQKLLLFGYGRGTG